MVKTIQGIKSEPGIKVFKSGWIKHNPDKNKAFQLFTEPYIGCGFTAWCYYGDKFIGTLRQCTDKLAPFYVLAKQDLKAHYFTDHKKALAFMVTDKYAKE